MLQDILISRRGRGCRPAPGANNAEALQQLGFSHMIQNQDFVARAF
jgi:hypothetical protein